MRVAFFIEIFYPEINGVLTATLNLAENMKRRGHQVLLVAPYSREFHEPRILNDIEVFYTPSFSTFVYPGVRFTWPWSRPLREKLLRDKIEIFHVTGPWTHAAAALLLGRKAGIPVVQTFHTMINEDSYLQYGVRLKFLMPLARSIIWRYMGAFLKPSTIVTAPSLYAKEEIEARFPELQVRHVPNGIDTAVFDQAAGPEELRRKWPLFNERSFVYVGRLGYEKSVDVLLQAFARVAAEDARARLFVVGDGPARDHLHGLKSSLGLDASVQFTGKIAHRELLTSGLLHHARAFVTASLTENQPMTVIEAACAGLPIVIADVRGIRELLMDNGLLFEPGDVAGLAGCLRRMLDDDQAVGRFKANSGRARRLFDGGEVAGRFEVLYDEARGRSAKAD